jgi:4-amino-4-deoxy-L-arabinose transferase-like glycosyltransferase
MRGRWHLWLALVSLAGALPGVIWVLTHKLHASPQGDALNFYWVARLIVTRGQWFVSPLQFLFHNNVTPSAQHPPLWSLVLAFFYVIGIHSYPAQLIATCFVGAGAVFLTGLAANEVGGRRAGMVAAIIAAAYPNYWINYSLGLSETLVLALVATVILVSVRVWRSPSTRGVALLCALVALLALTRAEQVLLFATLVLPLVVVMKGVDRRAKIRFLAVGVGVAVLLIGPWVGFNLSRFTKTTTFSTDLGTTLQMGNCHYSYYGGYMGAGDFRCLPFVKPGPGDESVHDAAYRSAAEHFMRKHFDRVPLVMLKRVGREFGLYSPRGQLLIETSVNYRPIWPAQVGLLVYYLLAAGGVWGAVLLRRRMFTLVPFAGILVAIVLTAMATFGQTRYRVPVDVVLVILSSVSVDALWTRRARRARHDQTLPPDPAAEPVPAPVA